MPLYEYHCSKCGRFETLQKFSDGPLAACPTCSGSVERLISAPAFQFKGTGWYVTDYGKSGSEGAASKESGAKGAETASSETASGTSKEAATPTSADSKSSTNSPPKEGTASVAKALAPAANTSQ
jgi:putative FmdB family regulatory protein